MKGVVVPPIVRDAFSLKVEHRSDVILKVTGNAEMEMLPLLGPFLAQLHDLMLAESERRIIVDFTELYFLNSSCFKSIITWISGVKKLDEAEAYKIVFRTNAKLHWQRRNLDAIQEFAPGIVEVDAM